MRLHAWVTSFSRFMQSVLAGWCWTDTLLKGNTRRGFFGIELVAIPTESYELCVQDFGNVQKKQKKDQGSSLLHGTGLPCSSFLDATGLPCNSRPYGTRLPCSSLGYGHVSCNSCTSRIWRACSSTWPVLPLILASSTLGPCVRLSPTSAATWSFFPFLRVDKDPVRR